MAFKSEIRNSPTQQIIKVFLNDDSLDTEIKSLLEVFKEIEHIEIRKSVERNRTCKNIAIFRHEGVDINILLEKIDESLKIYFDEK